MKTNLIFKRQLCDNGVYKTVTRVVSVDIPYINSGEGWILSGHSDYIEACEDVYVHHVAPVVTKMQGAEQSTVDKHVSNSEDHVTKFESNVKGTAKLVRSKGVIKIVARRGKTTYNQTTPNSVCINDFTKNEFFKNCREIHGNTGIFEFTFKDGNPYDYWNTVIDNEYNRQKLDYTVRGN